MTRGKALHLALLGAALASVVWVRMLGTSADVPGSREPFIVEEAARRPAANGREHLYLPGYDDWYWLRLARNRFERGSACDAVVDGDCRDLATHAPVGRSMLYPDTLHVRALAALHRVLVRLDPGHPLTETALVLQVLLGAACVLPAFAIGRMLAGAWGGSAAALGVGLAPILLGRSMGGDNDAWQVLLPLCMTWAAASALLASRTAAAAGLALLAGAVAGLHAGDWNGWPLACGSLLLGLLAVTAVQAFLRVRDRADTTPLRRALLVSALFAAATALSGTALGVDVVSTSLAVVRSELGLAAAGPGAAWPDPFRYVGELRPNDLRGIARDLGGPLAALGTALGALALLLPGRAGERRGAVPHAPAILVAVWLAATFAVAFRAARFSLPLAAPAGLAFGAAVGRGVEAMRAAPLRPGLRRLAGAAAMLAAAALLGLLVRQGAAGVGRELPLMEDAWWDALSELRETSPSDAIVTTWWPFGHWTAYVSERRVTADGASLRTHLPYWIARVLAAPSDAEATGILRMLDCGSEVGPVLPEGARGAYGRLRAAGLDGSEAVRWIDELVRLGRADAEALLAERGLAPAARSRVLAATHCAPPPAYLVLSTSLWSDPSWLAIASWDFAAGAERALPEPAAPHAWSCRTTPEGRLHCPIGRPSAEPGALLAVVFDPEETRAAPLRLASQREGPAPAPVPGTPAWLRVAGPNGIRDVAFPEATRPGLDVLVDLERARVYVGPPRLLRSTFVRLVLLDGAGSERFEKVSAQAGLLHRVTVWRVHW